MLSQDEMKRIVARYALSFVESDQVIGVGTGSTAMEFLKLLADCIKRGELRNVLLVPTSSEVEYMCHVLGIADLLRQPWQIDRIDVAIDGADEVDPEKNLNKGGGGALTGEKIIDYNAEKFIVIVDETKLVDKLGRKHPIPIEVVPRYWRLVASRVVSQLGGEVKLRILERGKRGPLVTDNGNYLLDWFKLVDEPEIAEKRTKEIPGVVEVGIFSREHVHKVLVACSDGKVIEM